MPSAPRESCSAHECTPKDAHESCSRCGRWGAASNESMPTGQLYARPSAQVTQQMGVYESQQWARGALVDLAGAPHYLRSFWHRGLPCCGRPPCSKGYDQCRPCGPGRVEEKGRDWAERERSRRVKSRRLDLRRVGRALGSILGFVDQESGRPTRREQGRTARHHGIEPRHALGRSTAAGRADRKGMNPPASA